MNSSEDDMLVIFKQHDNNVASIDILYIYVGGTVVLLAFCIDAVFRTGWTFFFTKYGKNLRVFEFFFWIIDQNDFELFLLILVQDAETLII